MKGWVGEGRMRKITSTKETDYLSDQQLPGSCEERRLGSRVCTGCICLLAFSHGPCAQLLLVTCVIWGHFDH